MNLPATTRCSSEGYSSRTNDVFVSYCSSAGSISFPIYALFDAVKGEFCYVWAHDENQRLAATNASWRDQGEFTHRFTQRLAPNALHQIADRILREGRMHRAIHDSLARATASEYVVVSIDQESLEIADPGRAQHVLLARSPALVASGL